MARNNKPEDRSPMAAFFALPDNWKELMREDFKKGLSDIEVYHNLGITRKEHLAMLEGAEEYREEIEEGLSIAEAYWLGWARDNIKTPSKDVNTKLFDKFMECVFLWDRRIVRENDRKKDEENKKKKRAEVDNFKGKYGDLKAV